MKSATSPLGATPLRDHRCHFNVWAPQIQRVEVHLLGENDRFVPMRRDERGYHTVETEGVEPGTLYRYRLDGERERPDPASRSQPEGVHGPSEVVELLFERSDGDWRGLPLEQHIILELHVGTFTPEGTFEAIIPKLAELADVGITALSLMPVAQFPGERNWGYDGVYPFAVQSSYGGPKSFARLVDACHAHGLAAILDVVYNHLGPEGNYLWDFAPYFTDRYRTPWGQAINFDGPDSDEVRRFFIENALQWVRDYRLDGLRLDALHAIFDFSAVPFLSDLTRAVGQEAQRTGRRIHLIGESDLNDARLIRPFAEGGIGLDAQWSDDFHHSLHTLLTGEQEGYYEDFGELAHLAKALREGYVYARQHSPHRRRRHGNDGSDVPTERFVLSTQTHDQVGNRREGERLTALVDFESLKLAAGLLLTAPGVPMLFMGEEHGESAPFLYFISHSDPDLVEAVRRGRQAEFESFVWEGEVPDPQAVSTFEQSKIQWGLRESEPHRTLLHLHRELLRIRREHPALQPGRRDDLEVHELDHQRCLTLRRWQGADQIFVAFNLSEEPVSIASTLPTGAWPLLIDSASADWRGPGSPAPPRLESQGQVTLDLAPRSFALFHREV